MRKLQIAFFLIVAFSGCQQKPTNTRSVSAPDADRTAKVYTTAHHLNLKMTLTDSLLFENFEQPRETQAAIVIDSTKKFQNFLGIGAAFTDAAAETFFKLSEENQGRFLDAYFNVEKGIGYSLARTTIHSCDFSSNSYTYIDEGDAELKSFTVDHDKKFRIPFIKKAIDAAGGDLMIYASPWSPPAFMKTNNNMLQGGKLKTEFYQVWANYFLMLS